MPEGPSVKRFQLLCSPFVGQTVTKVGGHTRQINPEDLKSLTLWDSQVSLAVLGSFNIYDSLPAPTTYLSCFESGFAFFASIEELGFGG